MTEAMTPEAKATIIMTARDRFSMAVRALNEAKEAGRNRVVFAPPVSAARQADGLPAWSDPGGPGPSRYLN